MAGTSLSTNTKKCSICGEVKPASAEYFHPNKGGKYGLRGQCIPCRRARVRAQIKEPQNAMRRKLYQDEYIASGRNAERNRKWRKSNPLAAAASKKRWRLKNPDRDRETAQRWRDQNRDKVRAKQKRAYDKLRSSPEYVLRVRMRKRIRAMLTGKAASQRTEEILGYTRSDLVSHIERQFTKGMTWEALLRGDIHIDHIIPVSAFNVTGVDCPEFKACWALTNLRPMWAADNFKKQAQVLTLL